MENNGKYSNFERSYNNMKYRYQYNDYKYSPKASRISKNRISFFLSGIVISLLSSTFCFASLKNGDFNISYLLLLLVGLSLLFYAFFISPKLELKALDSDISYIKSGGNIEDKELNNDAKIGVILVLSIIGFCILMPILTIFF
jgi:hypothetical protein